MKIKLSPQVSDDKIHYDFIGEKVVANIRGETDEFDFEEFPDGELQTVDPETGESLIKTSLPVIPILSAKRVGGELWIELLNWIDIDEDDDDILFPKWVKVDG